LGYRGEIVSRSIAAAHHTAARAGPGYSESLPKATAGAKE